MSVPKCILVVVDGVSSWINKLICYFLIKICHLLNNTKLFFSISNKKNGKGLG